MVYPNKKKVNRKKEILQQDIKLFEYSFEELEEYIWKNKRDSIEEILSISKNHFFRISNVQETFQFLETLEFNHFIQGLNKVEKYIPRKVSYSFFENNSKETKLVKVIELLKKEPKVALIGDPGYGKSFELIELAHQVASKEIGYPIFLRLKDCLPSKDFKDYLPEQYELLSRQKVILLLDGFDEIPIQEKDLFIQRFIDFNNSYPDVNLIFSIRSNFYSNVLEGKINGVCPVYLNKFSCEEISSYVSSFFEIDPEKFISSCYQNSLMEMAEIPYYLKLLALEYQLEGGLTGSSSEILRKLFENRIEHDLTNHFKNSLPTKVNKENIQDTLEKISSIMTIGGFTQIPHRFLKEIVPADQLEILSQLLIFKPSDRTSKAQWMFEHNKIRDYLSARSLLNLDINEVKQLVCVPNSVIICSNWKDAILLFLNIIPTSHRLFDPICNLVISNSKTEIFKVEREKFNPTIRFLLLKRILEYYKPLTIWIRLKDISENRLAYFSQSDDSFEYLLNEIENDSNHRRHRLSCLFILKEFRNLAHFQKEQLKTAFLPILKESQSDVHLTDYLIQTFARLRITDQATIIQFRKLYSTRKNQFIRGGMYEFIANLDDPDEWVDYLLEGMLLKKSNDPDRDGISNGAESLLIENAFQILKKPSSFTKVLEEFLSNDDYHLNFNFDKILDIVLKKSIEHYISNPNLYNLVLALHSKLNGPFHHEYTDLFHHYFKETNSYNKGLIDLLEKSSYKVDYGNNYEIGFFVRNDTFPTFEKLLSLGKLTFEDSEKVYFALKAIGNDFHPEFKKKIEHLSGKKIILEKQIDTTNMTQKRQLEELACWFKKEVLKEEIIKILDQENEITIEKLSKSLIGLDHLFNQRLGIHHCAKKVLRDLLNKDSKSSIEIKRWLANEEEIEYYLIYRIHLMIYHHDPNQFLNNQQINFLQSWFERNLDTVDFYSINLFGQVNQYQLYKAVYLTYFYENFGFPCSEEKSLEMLAFCNHTHGKFQTVTLETIIKRVGRSKVEKRIEENILNQRIQNTLAVKTHNNYAFKYKKEHLFPVIFNSLLNSSETGSVTPELSEFFRTNNDPRWLFPLFWKFIEEDQRYIIDHIPEEHFNEDLRKLINDLIKLPASKDLEKSINNLLLKKGDIDGMKRTLKWINKYKINPFSHSNIELVHFNNIEALPYLLILLKTSYDKEILDNERIDTIWSKARFGLIELAKRSQEFAITIINELEKFIEIESKSIDDIRHNYEIVEDIKILLSQEKLQQQPLTFKQCFEVYERVY
ncbi:hypothetical protein FHS59_004528 [Algoriphagus iocasae]|uniref:NACHT domain-containing protein n=2 Tax=Algoriphagus iocasae TaxID=1836499 RepID=A0A841MT08_9BACT|nr:hypothetical protein [Algoriphagus iocasae]MBB6328869.1 hypothetical protein [Algoriphagus iocasae]